MDYRSAVLNTETRVLTKNGMETLESSLDACTDLFFMIGASRGKDLTVPFARAHASNRELALRTLLWARDARGGAGERDTFRRLLAWLEANHPEDAERLIPAVPEMGRWDDLLVLTRAAREQAFSLIAHALLVERNALAAKWMPRKGETANALRQFLGLTPKDYRKLLVSLSDTVEQKMCGGRWDEIEFGSLPSLAAARYQKTFVLRCAERYAAYKKRLKKGKDKVNAGALYPYDVLKAIRSGDAAVAKAQWEALPRYLGDDHILPMVDVSGSMYKKVGTNDGRPSTLTCLDVALALGLYLADKQTGDFKDMFLTFSRNPKIQILKGDILQKLNQLEEADWAMNTNVELAYLEILRVAVANDVPPSRMPRYLLILSDMEFDACLAGKGTAYEAARAAFTAAGYNLPKIVFWNLYASGSNTPVRYDQDGTALVSGFSPTLMRSILAAQEFNPRAVMLEAVMAERYTLPDPRPRIGSAF